LETRRGGRLVTIALLLDASFALPYLSFPKVAGKRTAAEPGRTGGLQGVEIWFLAETLGV
jgi:hypothetical protein